MSFFLGRVLKQGVCDDIIDFATTDMPIQIKFSQDDAPNSPLVKLEVNLNICNYFFLRGFGGKELPTTMSPMAHYFSRSVAVVDLRGTELLVASNASPTLIQWVGQTGPNLVDRIRKVRFLVEICAQDKDDQRHFKAIAGIIKKLRVRFSKFAVVDVVLSAKYRDCSEHSLEVVWTMGESEQKMVASLKSAARKFGGEHEWQKDKVFDGAREVARGLAR